MNSAISLHLLQDRIAVHVPSDLLMLLDETDKPAFSRTWFESNLNFIRVETFFTHLRRTHESDKNFYEFQMIYGLKTCNGDGDEFGDKTRHELAWIVTRQSIEKHWFFWWPMSSGGLMILRARFNGHDDNGHE